jgi:hypothetical protein
MSYSNFTSLPPEEEQQFVVFERRTKEASSKAMTLGVISGAVVGLFLVTLYLTSDPPKQLHADALDSDIPAEASTKDKDRDRAEPKAAPVTGDSADTADEGDAEGSEGDAEGSEGDAEGDAAEGATEAPPPPKGATKAPPTALVK